MRPALREAFEAEMTAGRERYRDTDYTAAFHHFERAHVLGQRLVGPHTRAHWWILRIGWKTRSLREVVGQLLRIPGGIVGSAIGLVPIGNTGVGDVSAFKRMPIPDDLTKYLEPWSGRGTRG